MFFFWAAHRLAALHARVQLDFITIFSDPDALSLRTCRPDVLLSFNIEGMVERGFRVSAARRRGKAKALSLLLFQRPLHPVNSDALYMPRREHVNHRSCKRVRSVSAHGLPY
jgi:hypothetical protein